MAAERIRQMGKTLNRWLRLDPKKTNPRRRRSSNPLQGIETVEHRRMLAGTQLVADVDVVPDSIHYEGGLELDGSFYFIAHSDEHDTFTGYNLWRYDPDANGGQGEAEPLDREIILNAYAHFRDMIVFDGKIFFAASREGGSELWSYDPATEAFTEITALRSYGDANTTQLAILNNKLYFCATNEDRDRGIWVYDPSGNNGAEGATNLALFAGDGPEWMKAVGNRLYFSYDDPNQDLGEELWYFDPGANNGLGEMGVAVDINPGAGSSLIDNAIVWNDKLYFSAKDGTYLELREYDPAAANGQGELTTLSNFQLTGGSNPIDYYAVLGDRLYFDGQVYETGSELWRYDPSDGSVEIVEDFVPSLSSSDPQMLTVVGDKLFYTGSAGINDNGLLLYDPAANNGQGAITKVDLPGGFRPYYAPLATFQDKLVFFDFLDQTRGPSIGGPVLYDPEANGGLGEVTFLPNVLNDTQSSSPTQMLEVNGKYYFQAHEKSTYTQLWEYDPAAAAGVNPIRQITGDAVEHVEDIYLFDGKIYFSGYDVPNGQELWVFDPMANGGDGAVSLVADVAMGSRSGSPAEFTGVDGKLYFSAYDASYDEELYVYDPEANGGEGEVRLAADIRPDGSSNPRNLAEYQGKLYMGAYDGVSGVEVWVYDPAANGGTGEATLFAELVPGWYGAYPRDFTEFNGKLYFAAEDDDGAFELWEYNPDANGGIEPLRRLVNLKDDTFPIPAAGMLEFDGKLYFCAYNDAFGEELWVYDPSTDSVSMVADVAPGELDFSPIEKIVFDGKLYMIGSGPSGDNQLWAYDPAALEGLGSLTKVDLNYNEGILTDLQQVWTFGGKIYIDAFDINYGHELFVYDANQVPSAVNDTYSLQEDTPLTIDAAAGILSNDSEVGDGPLMVRVITDTSHGALIVNNDGSFTYTADANYHGADSFIYEVEDRHGEVTTGTVQLTILSVNDLAMISGDTGGNIDEDKADDYTGTLIVTDVDPGESNFVVQTNTAGSYGTFSLDASGNWNYTLDRSSVQSLNAGDQVVDVFVAESADGVVLAILIQINGLNDVPVVGGDSVGSVTEDGTLTATGTATVTDPDEGESSFQAGTGTTPYGSFSVDASGNWTYNLDNAKAQKLADGQMVADTFTVLSLDGSSSLDITITITGQNDPATITGELIGVTTEEAMFGVEGVATINDIDEGQSAFQPLAGDTTYGQYAIDVNGNWIYNLDNAKVQDLPTGQIAVDTFTIISQDGSASREVTVQITGVNDPPVIDGDTSGTTDEDATADVTGTLTISDVDANENRFVAQVNMAGTAGTFSIDALGNWTYQLDNAAVQSLPLGQKLSETFTVVSADGSEQLVTIDVHGTNDPPVATIVSVEGYSFVGNTIDVVGMVEDVDDDIDAIIFNYSVYHGDDVTPVISSNDDLNHFSFTPQLTGEYRIVLSVRDEQGVTATAEQTITIGEASSVDLQLGHGSTYQVGDTDDGSFVAESSLHEWEDATGELWLTIDEDLPQGPLDLSFQLMNSGELLLSPQVVDYLGTASLESEVVDEGIRSTLMLSGVDLASYEVGDRILLAKIAYPKNVDNAEGVSMEQAGVYPQPITEHGVQLVSAELEGEGQALAVQANAPVRIAPVVYDANDDGRVGLADFAAFIANYGHQPDMNDADAYRFDYNQDGRVGISDFALFIRHYGKRKSQANVSVEIPEAMTTPPAASSTFAVEGEPSAVAPVPAVREMVVLDQTADANSLRLANDTEEELLASLDSADEFIIPVEHAEVDARLLDAAVCEITLSDDGETEEESIDWIL